MRTAIILGALIIARQLGEKKFSESQLTFVATILLVCMIMDIIEFGKRMLSNND